jgi:hypothetical protein
MEIDLPAPIDDSVPLSSQQQNPWNEPPQQEEQEPPRYYQEPVYYMQQPPPQPQKKFDIFSELDRTHWIIIISLVLLAFFIGKSIATPIIIRATN